jgi:hypothetical protein
MEKPKIKFQNWIDISQINYDMLAINPNPEAISIIEDIIRQDFDDD